MYMHGNVLGGAVALDPKGKLAISFLISFH